MRERIIVKNNKGYCILKRTDVPIAAWIIFVSIYLAIQEYFDYEGKMIKPPIILPKDLLMWESAK